MSTLTQQIEELQRELSKRQGVYPRWIQTGAIKEDVAQRRIQLMADAIETMKKLLIENDQDDFKLEG